MAFFTKEEVMKSFWKHWFNSGQHIGAPRRTTVQLLLEQLEFREVPSVGPLKQVSVPPVIPWLSSKAGQPPSTPVVVIPSLSPDVKALLEKYGTGKNHEKPGLKLNPPQRNNNPLDIKYGPATASLVASGQAKIDPAKPLDGGHFLKFKSVYDGFVAGINLLRSNVYANYTVDAGLKKWSLGGYNGSLYPEVRKKQIGRLNATEMANLVMKMARHEGFFANNYYPPIYSGKPY